jgi:uncharacterized protein YjbJ (UPF0337 family)
LPTKPKVRRRRLGRRYYKDAVKEVQQSRKDTATGKAHETRGKISQSVQDAKEKINEKIEELKEGYSS